MDIILSEFEVHEFGCRSADPHFHVLQMLVLSLHVHTCQPDRSQMTEIFPIDDARALTGNGRRACTAHSLTAVAHLDL